jgi:hypothetical protein
MNTRCRYCEETFETDTALSAHLTEAHDTDELDRIDRRRVKQYTAEETGGLSRRTALLGSVTCLGAAAGLWSVGVSGLGLDGPSLGATDTSGKPPNDSNQSISFSNADYDITFGETESNDWVFDGTDLLFDEFYALRDGSGTVTSERDATIVDPYPDSGTPGTTYSAIVELSLGGTPVEITRFVELDSTDALLTTTYSIENIGSSSLSNLRFYQFLDYDIGVRAFGDTAQYVSSPFEYIYQEDGGVYTAYRATVTSDRHDVDDQGVVRTRIAEGNMLQNNNSHGGDPGSALRLNLGTLDPGDVENRTVAFAAGNSQQEVEDLLAGLEPLLGPGIRIGSGAANVTISNSTVTTGEDN